MRTREDAGRGSRLDREAEAGGAVRAVGAARSRREEAGRGRLHPTRTMEICRGSGGRWRGAEALPAAARDRDLTDGVVGKLGLRSGDRWGGSMERWPAGMRRRRGTLSTGARLGLDSGLTAYGESE
jgi:hypothetical protein